MSESEKPLLTEEPDLSSTYTASDYLRWNLDELLHPLTDGEKLHSRFFPQLEADLTEVFKNVTDD